ncbi:hypothetical protein BJ138DRAFT_207807 [Hygrophoropsis aurantiaca]|uniref:Uncharacterized protein n=1 Tax=Hygrophoropsis aurantiaca TaxID=72124 RepID=A0ACB8A957_9AGAM|nr:hypothetical protein BJ138DRAFT_207807 [Hygrophoropsis aurantiaca]
MVLKGHNTLSFSIFPRFGLGSNHKSDTVDHTRDAEKRDEDWYIPYNKPYEPPRNASMAVRDNWTNRVHQEEVDHTMGETVLPHRYGGGINVNHSDPGGQGLLPANHGASLRNRARSDVTPRAVSSSSGINPNTTRSRRYPSTTQRTQAPVVTNSTTHGGIGESPSPPQRLPSPPQSSKRASFFSFGSSRKFQHPHQPPQAPPSSYPKTMPGEWPSGSPSQSAGIHAASVPITSEVDEYFDSYYSTLIPPSKTRSNGNLNLPRVDTSNLLGKRLSGRTALSDAPDSSVSSPATTYNSPTYTHAPHPYAYASSSTSLQIPRNISQPLRHTPSQIHHQQQGSGSSASNYSRTLHPTFPVSVTHNPRVPRNALDVSRHNTSALPLKASVSTPDLYSASRANVPTPRPTKKTSPPVSKGIDRWFSAETWCDAVLFPRPRFKIKTGAGTSDSGSGRIISPPSTPISGDQAPETGTRTKASLFGGRPRAASVMDGERKERRSLVKSRSAADLLSGPSVPSIPLREITRSDYFRAPAAEQNKPEEPKEAEAQDELPLPTPVPSLTQYVFFDFFFSVTFRVCSFYYYRHTHVFKHELLPTESSKTARFFSNSARLGKTRLPAPWGINVPDPCPVHAPRPFRTHRPALVTKQKGAELSISSPLELF